MAQHNIIIGRGYIVVKRFLSDAMIERYFQLASRRRGAPSALLVKVRGRERAIVDRQTKRRRDVFFSEAECAELDRQIFTQGKQLVKKYLNKSFMYREKYKLGEYTGEDRGFYKPHTDTQGAGGAVAHRVVSMVACCSEAAAYDGGVFRLVRLGDSFRFDKGDAIFFDSNLLHGVEPVTGGVRHVLISFFSNSLKTVAGNRGAAGGGSRGVMAMVFTR